MPRQDNIDFDATRALIAQGIEERRRKHAIPVVGPDGQPTGEFYDERLGKPPGQPDKADLVQILSAMQEKYPDIKVLPTGEVEGIPYESEGLVSSIGNILGRGYRESLTGQISALKEKVPSLKPFTGVAGYIFDAIYEATKNVEHFQPNEAEDIAASLASFLMPIDAATLAIGGGAGAIAGKVGLKAGTAIAAKAGAKKVSLRLAKGVVSTAKSAGALGAYEGARELLDQVAKGDLNAIKLLKRTGGGALLGSAFGVISAGIGPAKAGASVLAKTGREVGKFAAETGVLGTVPPALEGRLPDFEDVKGAAKFAFALRIMNGAMKVPGFVGKGGDKLRQRWAERNVKKLETELADVETKDLRERVFEISGVTTGEQARDRAREIKFKKKTKPSNAPAIFKPEKAEAELGKKVHGSLGLTGNETNIFMFTERFRGEPEQTKGKDPKLTKRGGRTRSIYGEGKSGVVVGEYLKGGKKYYKILDIGSHGNKEIEARLKGRVEAYGKKNNVNIYLKGAEAKTSLRVGRAKKGATGLVRIEKSTAGKSLEALDKALREKEIDETTHAIYKELINENPELYANNPIRFTNKVVRATKQMLKDEGFTEKKGGLVLGTTVVERAKGGIVRLTTAINRGADVLTVAEEHAHGFYEFRLRKGVKNHNAEWSKIVDDSYVKSGSKLAKEEWFAKIAAKHIIENVRTSLPGLASILDKLKKSFLKIIQVIKREGLVIPKELEPLLRKVAREKLVKEVAVKERKAGTRDRMRAKKAADVSRETKKEVVVAQKPKLDEKQRAKLERAKVVPKDRTEFHQIRIRDAYQNVSKRVSEIGQLTDKGEIAKDAILKRSTEIEKKSYEIYEFRKKHEKGLTEAEKTDLIFYLEGTENPKIPTSRVISRLSPKAKTIAIALRGRFDQVRKEINASGLTSNRNYLEDYVTHFWSGSKEAVARLRNSFKVRDPFAQRRGIEKYASEQAEKLGLKPKYHNIFDILGEYERLSERIVQNNEMVRHLKNTKTQEGDPLIIGRASKAPSDYVELRNNALASAIGGRGSVYVHPEIYKPLQTVFGEPFGGKFFTMVERINAITKKLKLIISMFHPVALTESGLYSGISPFKIKQGLKLLENKAIRDDMLEHGLVVTAPSDVSRALFDKAMDIVARKFGPLGKALRFANKKNDQFLWDYMHPGFKAITYYEKLNWALKKNPNLTTKEIKEVKRSIATHVNNAFGGQNWDALLKSPKWRQVAHMLFLAPDWTLSNIRIATSAFKTGRGGIGAKIEGQLARRYWARAAIVFFTASNLANYALSGHWMWENEGDKEGEDSWWVPDFLEGHRLDIDTGNRDEKGRRMFIKFSKQVREVGKWLIDPLDEALVKSSPFLQILFEQISGRSVTGWPTAIDRDDGFWESIPSRIVTLAKHLRPFSLSGNNALLSFPVSKGASPGEILRGKLKSGYHRNRWRTRILDLYIGGNKRDADKMLKEWNKQFPKFELTIKDVSYKKIKARIKHLEKQAGR